MTASLPPKRYSDAELQEFQAMIEAKVLETSELLDKLKISLDTSHDQSSGKTLQNTDNMPEYFEKEFLFMMIARQTRYLHQLRMALNRIGNNTYGICKVTGELIDKKRLMAVPHTTMSVEAKMRR